MDNNTKATEIGNSNAQWAINNGDNLDNPTAAFAVNVIDTVCEECKTEYGGRDVDAHGAGLREYYRVIFAAEAMAKKREILAALKKIK